jgi:hypothetical protein
MPTCLRVCITHQKRSLGTSLSMSTHQYKYIYILMHETWCVRVRTKISQPFISSFFSSSCSYAECDLTDTLLCREYLVQACRWPPAYATAHLLSFYNHTIRIITQLENLLCSSNPPVLPSMQLTSPPVSCDAVAVHSHFSGAQLVPCSGAARLRSVVAPARWHVMMVQGDGLAIRRNGSSVFEDVVTPCKEYLVVLAGKCCPVQGLAGGAGVRCSWEHGRGEWHALHLHVGLEQVQSAAETALLGSLGGTSMVGARANGKWTWQDKCSD